MKKAPALRFFGSAGAVSETNLRACYVSFYVRIFAHDFVGDKEKNPQAYCRTARIFDAVSGKICRKDVRKKM